MNGEQNPEAEDGPLNLRIREGATRYGYPQSTLYEWSLRGVPGFIRIGRSVRIHRPTFERWLAQQANGNDDRPA